MNVAGTAMGFLFRRHFHNRLNRRKPLEPGKYSPFVYRNRDTLEKALAEAVCEKCGYKGRAMLLVPPEGETSVNQRIFSSERAVKRALQRAARMCCNCYYEGLEPPDYPARGKPHVRVLPVATRAVSLHPETEGSDYLNTPVSTQPLQDAVAQGIDKLLSEDAYANTDPTSTPPRPTDVEPTSRNAQ